MVGFHLHGGSLRQVNEGQSSGEMHGGAMGGNCNDQLGEAGFAERSSVTAGNRCHVLFCVLSLPLGVQLAGTKSREM